MQKLWGFYLEGAFHAFPAKKFSDHAAKLSLYIIIMISGRGVEYGGD